MPVQIQTRYDQKALTAMARGLRKTVRRKRSRRSHVFGWLVLALALVLGLAPLFQEPPEVNGLTLAVAAVLLAVLLFEDAVNGFFARRKLMPGTEESTTTFTGEHYITRTRAGETIWPYENIQAIAEGERYLVLALSRRHAQAFDKQGLTQGSLEELRTLLQERTGLPIVNIR